MRGGCVEMSGGDKMRGGDEMSGGDKMSGGGLTCGLHPFHRTSRPR